MSRSNCGEQLPLNCFRLGTVQKRLNRLLASARLETITRNQRLSLGCLLGCLLATLVAAAAPPQKKLIEFGWEVEEVSKNYFTPETFETSVRAALETADEYVWIYTETPRWWLKDGGPVKLLPAYVEALRNARKE